MPRELRIGDVVEITSPGCPTYKGKQGAIIRINPKRPHKDGPIRVRFPKVYEDLQQWTGDSRPFCIWFEPKDFRIVPGGFHFEPKAEIKFLWKDMAHSFNWPTFPLLPGKSRCHVKDCINAAFFKIWYNYWGGATQYYVCAEHAKLHLIAGEGEDFCVEPTPEEMTTTPPSAEISITEQAKMLFGENWQVKRPEIFFVPRETLCVHSDCKAKAIFQILVNCWGSIYQMDVCRDHVHLHGARLTDVPYKPAIAQLPFIIEDQIDLHELAMA